MCVFFLVEYSSFEYCYMSVFIFFLLSSQFPSCGYFYFLVFTFRELLHLFQQFIVAALELLHRWADILFVNCPSQYPMDLPSILCLTKAVISQTLIISLFSHFYGVCRWGRYHFFVYLYSIISVSFRCSSTTIRELFIIFIFFCI